MDLHTGLVYVGVVVVSAVVILLVSMFGMKEKSYEEAIAEQRKLPEDHLLLGKKEKGKEKKHKNKTGKKVKEKKEDKDEKEEKTEHRTAVQFDETPVVLPTETATTEVSKGAKKKNRIEKVKPILANKGETPVISTELLEPDVLATDVNHFDRIHPKDSIEFIRRHSQQKETASLQQSVQSDPIIINKSPKETPTKTKKNVKEPAKKKEEAAGAAVKDEKKEPIVTSVSAPHLPIVKEAAKEVQKEVTVVVKEQKESVLTPQQSLSKESKKGKKKNDILAQIGGDRDGINVSLLMPLVQKAELSRSEIQILIDQLLNKQQDNPSEHSEWTEGRTDPVIKLKKQLAEKDKALTEQHEASVTVQNKLKEVRAELNAERSRLTTVSNQLGEALNAKTTEAQTLFTRMQHILESHVAEKQGFARQIEQLQTKVNEDAAIIQKMQEDQGQTQGHMQQELIAQRKQLEVQFGQMRENENALKAQLAQKHVEVQDLQNVNMNLTQELQATCESSTAEIEILRQQLAMMQDQFMHSEGQLQHLKEAGDRMQDMARQIEESHRAHADFDHRLKSAHRHEQELQKQVHSLQAELKISKAEANETTALKSELNKVQAELIKSKSDCSVSQSEAMKRDEQFKYYQAEASKLASVLLDERDELTRMTSELAKAQEDLRQQRGENETIFEQLTKASSKISKLEVEVTAATANEVAKLEHEALQNGNRKATDVQLQITRLQEENDRLSAQLGKFTELQKELKQLREENESLGSQLAATTERPAAEGRENGVGEQMQKNSVQLLEHEYQLERKENQLDALKIELTNKELELGQLRTQVENLESDVNKQSSAVNRFQNDLEVQRSKNNELRTKNWKVMEALSAAESRIKTNTGKCIDDTVEKIKADEQECTKSLLQRIFPEVKVTEKYYDRWLGAFEAQVNILLTELRNRGDFDATVPELEKQNKKLQSMVLHYQQIIDDTEVVLHTLESHIKSTESRWESQLLQKENEVLNLRIELKELQDKLMVNEKLQQKIIELESRLAEEENLREESKAEIPALRQANESSVKGGVGNEFFVAEQLQEERNKRAKLDEEVAKLRSIVDSREANLVDGKNVSQISRLNAETCGASSISDQSTPNGPATSDSSKSEPTKATVSLIAALEKPLLTKADNENGSVSDSESLVQSQRETGCSFLTSEINSKNCHATEHNMTQASWNPLNCQQHKKHKKKRKGGSGKK